MYYFNFKAHSNRHVARTLKSKRILILPVQALTANRLKSKRQHTHNFFGSAQQRSTRTSRNEATSSKTTTAQAQAQARVICDFVLSHAAIDEVTGIRRFELSSLLTCLSVLLSVSAHSPAKQQQRSGSAHLVYVMSSYTFQFIALT